MPYDESLAARVRKALGVRTGLTERTMFGGLCFLVDGRMCCGVVGDRLVVRVGPEANDEAHARKHVRPMDFTGKPLRGSVYVMPEGLTRRRAIDSWVAEGLRYAESLPAKATTRPARRVVRRTKR